MLIKQVNANTFDVFTGTGWDNWSRFESKKGSLYLVKGNSLNRADYNAACTAIRNEKAGR